MGYVAESGWDVFVSYASRDNKPLTGQEHGWVDVFEDKLQTELQSRLGARELKIYFDRKDWHSNIPIMTQLLDAARESVTLVLVMSPNYLSSEWCDRERTGFLGAVNARPRWSVFVARMRPVDQHRLPAELRDLTGTPFFETVDGPAGHRLLGVPDPNEPLFLRRIGELSGEIAAHLERAKLGGGGGQRPPEGPDEPGPWPPSNGEGQQRILEAQQLLSELGVLRSASAVDGINGPATIAAVMAFQRAHGLQVDGIVGPKTWAKLREVAGEHC